MPSTSQTQSTQQDLLDAIHSAQGTAIDMVESWTESLGEALPKLWGQPVAEGIPAPQQLSETAFRLAHKVIDAQHEFTKRLVEAVDSARKKLR